jgi:RNA polymerase sigma factor (sigma-70 family)
MSDAGDDDDDFLLLQRYVRQHSQDAFAQLVNRYLGLVYASARRQTSDAHLAEDVTQKVFLALAQKARTLTAGVILSSWLLSATRYIASNTRLVEARRRHHETKAAQMHGEVTAEESGGPEWAKISPWLDEAIGELSPVSRDALALRFFDSKSVAEVAQSLKLTEEATRQRISRAVRQLRSALQGRGWRWRCCRGCCWRTAARLRRRRSWRGRSCRRPWQRRRASRPARLGR